MARSMVSRVMLATSAAFTAARRRGFIAGSGMPVLAETVISRISLPKAWARLAPWVALRCMTFLACEWPAMAASLSRIRGNDGSGGLLPAPAGAGQARAGAMGPGRARLRRHGHPNPRRSLCHHHRGAAPRFVWGGLGPRLEEGLASRRGDGARLDRRLPLLRAVHRG